MLSALQIKGCPIVWSRARLLLLGMKINGNENPGRVFTGIRGGGLGQFNCHDFSDCSVPIQESFPISEFSSRREVT